MSSKFAIKMTSRQISTRYFYVICTL